MGDLQWLVARIKRQDVPWPFAWPSSRSAAGSSKTIRGPPLGETVISRTSIKNGLRDFCSIYWLSQKSWEVDPLYW